MISNSFKSQFTYFNVRTDEKKNPMESGKKKSELNKRKKSIME
jgi:hypothetical protein